MGFRGVIGVDSSNVVHVIPFQKINNGKNFGPSEDTRGQIESAEVIAAILTEALLLWRVEAKT